jgi:hypothetical protein
MKIAMDITALIGSTLLVRLNKVSVGSKDGVFNATCMRDNESKAM